MTSQYTDNPLLEASFLQRLQRLQLLVRRPLPGQWKGEHRSPRRGYSVEFADFREYTPGDDLRYVDWKAFGRLERLYLKQFVEEEDLYVLLLVDSSRSMRFGTPPKLRFAQQIAASLGYVALCRFHRVAAGFLFDGAVQWMSPVRGRSATVPLFTFLGNAPAGEKTELLSAVRAAVARWRQRGVVYLLSDLMDPRWQDALRLLPARGHEIILLHILSPQELNPDLSGDLLLVDSETGETREVSLSPAVIERYQHALQQMCRQASQICAQLGGSYLLVPTDYPLEALILQEMRRKQVLV